MEPMPQRFFELADKVFRCEGWESPLIVAEEIHDSLERIGATGTRFEEA
jgi:hypothetical protein